MKKIFVFCLLIATIRNVFCARILCVAPMPSFSHQLFFRPIWRELANRGHELILLTTDPMVDPPANIKQIDWHFTYNSRRNEHNITKMAQVHEYNLPKVMSLYQAMLNDIVEQELNHPEVLQLIGNHSEHFDVVITEFHHPVMLAFSHHFKCPLIGIASSDISNYYHDLLGNPTNPVLYPEMMLPFDGNLKFSERVISTLLFMYFKYVAFTRSQSKEDELVVKYFGEDTPKVIDIAKNVSMVFLNIHPVFNVRPLGPGFITIGGGTHLAQLKPLPKELKEFLDSAVDGAIYFSLGTNVRSNDLTQEFIQVFIDTFKELPYKILWKFEDDLPQISNNVKMVKWAPQQDVLRHENIKLFITQCGLQSLDETILSHVPLIGIPFVSDQKMNVKKIVNRGLGLHLDRKAITKDKLKAAIEEVIHNPKYKNNVKHVAKLFQDQPMSGLEKAVWWTEYVIRNKGAKHLWRSGLDIPWYQSMLLDVLGSLFLFIGILLYVTFKLLTYILRKTGLLYKNVVKQKTC